MQRSGWWRWRSAARYPSCATRCCAPGPPPTGIRTPPRPASRRRRQLRTWRDAEGGWNLTARGTVGDGARVEAARNPLIDAAYATARAAQRHEPREAYAFDALVALTQRPDSPDSSMRPTPRTTTIVRVDLDALTRGRVHDDEVCDIRGIGPIPVATARQLLGQSILKLVITKGTEVLNVTHLGRGPNTAQHIALLWSAPTCTVEGCCRTRVENDHREPFAKTKHTRLDELDPLCQHHHDQKTNRRWELVHGVGKRAMVPPDDPRHPKNKPKRDTS
ncbi:MAG: hypothetical protein JOZ99_09010 [Actinobacteria bacterium]|nr:hypothetical protein [Actinomycetota bacterium]